MRPPGRRRIAFGVGVGWQGFALCGALFVGGALADLTLKDFAMKFELP